MSRSPNLASDWDLGQAAKAMWVRFYRLGMSESVHQGLHLELAGVRASNAFATEADAVRQLTWSYQLRLESLKAMRTEPPQRRQSALPPVPVPALYRIDHTLHGWE